MKGKCIIKKINMINEASIKFLTTKIKEEGLDISPNHASLFEILPEDGSKLIFNEIAATWNISKSSLSDIINKYENQSLLNKCVCSEDKRSVYISLTKSGITVKQRVEEIEEEFKNTLLKDFDTKQKETFEKNIDAAIKSVWKML